MLSSFRAQAQNLFVASFGPFNVSDGHIYQFTPDGTRSTFASGLSGPYGLAFQPVPEPSVFGLLIVGTTALFAHRRKQ